MIDRAKANADALKACAVLGGFFVVLAAGGYLFTLRWDGAFPRDGSTLVVGRDFLDFWMFGRAAALPNPGAWYDPRAFQDALAALVGDGYPGQNLAYPPTFMLFTAPFARLGYFPALLLWTLLGLGVFAATGRRFLRNRLALIAVLCSPAAIFGLISGQVSYFATAAMIGSFVLLDRRPIAAGVLIGLLSMKPHLGVLFPIMLAVSGRWRAFTTAAVTTVALALVSIALFGLQPWIDFVRIGLPVDNIVLSNPSGIATPFFTSVYMNLRGVGVPYSTAIAVQAAVAVAAAGLVAWAFRLHADADPRLLTALFLTCAACVTPYFVLYDTLPMTVAAISLLTAEALDARGRLLSRLVYWLPLLQIGFGTLHIPGPALIAPAFALYLALRVRAGAQQHAHAALRAT